jgi:hypothetical protein
VVPEDPVKFLLSQILHILNNGGYLIGLISSTAQLKESYRNVTKYTENHIHWLIKIFETTT